jgi:hypothetical protein
VQNGLNLRAGLTGFEPQRHDRHEEELDRIYRINEMEEDKRQATIVHSNTILYILLILSEFFFAFVFFGGWKNVSSTDGADGRRYQWQMFVGCIQCSSADKVCVNKEAAASRTDRLRTLRHCFKPSRLCAARSTRSPLG